MMRRSPALLLSGFLLLASWGVPHARAVFSSPRSFPAGDGPFIATAADVNGDGRPDLIVPDREGNAVSVLFGDGHGGFSAPVPFPAGRGPRSAACADLNGDAMLDIVVANRDSGDLTLLYGDGKGGFPRSAELPISRGPQMVALADLNGDGAPDLTVAAREARRILIYLNDGEGRFSGPVKLMAGKGPRAVIATDLNGDDIPDVASANRIDGTVTLRFGDGTGRFPASSTLAAGRSPTMLAHADVNRDGRPDLIVSDRTTTDMVFGKAAPGIEERGRIYIYTGDGGGGFSEPAAWHAGGHPAGFAVADLDGDGLLDIAVADNAPDHLIVLAGEKGGRYGEPTVISTEVGRVPRTVLAVDLNGDGRPDLVVPSRDSDRVFVLMNITPE